MDHLKKKGENRAVLCRFSLNRVTLPLNILVLKLSAGICLENNICVGNFVQHFALVVWE